MIIDRAHALGLFSLPELKILRAIVVALPVNVMHVLVRRQRAAEHGLHDVAVFELPAALRLDFHVAGLV